MKIKKTLVLSVMTSLMFSALAENEKSLVDFFLPMEIQKPLVSEGIWGNENAVPRDTTNGLEDAKLENWCYWDGGVVKSDDGKYHIYASRWSQGVSHADGWKIDSKAIHAVSDNVNGPYIDKGLVWPDWKPEGEGEESAYLGIGSNVSGFRLHDGRYGVVTSETTPGYIFVSDNPDGPFQCLGKIQVDCNGFPEGLAFYGKAPNHMSNVQILPRPDGKYMLIGRMVAPMLSENGILGPYKIMATSVYAKYGELPQSYNEDPCIWYSGGLYHIMYNHWPTGCCYHFTSADGVSKWKYRGIAFKKGESKIFRYTDGTENNWAFIERPQAIVENDHVTHFIFSVIDVIKGGDQANDNHGSKIVVVPFDGVAFDEYMKEVVSKDDPDEKEPTYENEEGDNNALNSHVFSFEPVNNTVGAGWYVQHTAQFALTNEKAAHGDYSLKFSNTDADVVGTLQTQGSYTNAVFATPTVDAGDYVCKIKCFAETQAPDNFHVAFIYTGGFKSVDYNLSSIDRNEWVELSVPVTLPDVKEGSRKINLQVKPGGQILGTMYIDQIRLEPKTTTVNSTDTEELKPVVIANNGTLKVFNSNNTEMSIYDLTGKIVFSNTITADYETLNPSLEKGVYIVRIGSINTKIKM